MTRIDPEQGINTLTEYVPSTGAVEGGFSEFNTVSIAQFRRWLNAVKAQAWEEGYGTDEECGMPRENPYLDADNE